MSNETPSPSLDTTPVSPEGDKFTYQLLTGHNRTNGSYKSDRELRMEYIQLTDRLVYKMTDGVEVINPATGEQEMRIPDTVIFLDKSARPLAWLTRELWERLATDPETGTTPPMPDFKFLNIDREQWVNTIDPAGNGQMDINRVDQSIIRSLRSIFIDPRQKEEGLTENIDTTPASLDGKVVMVVDEVYSSGRTLDIATQFVRRAFPDAFVGGTYWMKGIATQGMATGNADIPVWYKDDEVRGRGVGDRQVGGIAEQQPKSLTQRLGGWFLSTRFKEPDQQALRLREEFNHLATHPDVPIRPSNEREDVLERLEYLNGGNTAKDVLNAIASVIGKPLGK